VSPESGAEGSLGQLIAELTRLGGAQGGVASSRVGDDHPFASLAGTWRGEGRGEYPTIAEFRYTEELTISPIPGRPVAAWRSATRDAVTGEPKHGESGYLRSTPQGIELVIAHTFGVVEATAGTLERGELTLGSTGLLGTASAKQIDGVQRRYRFEAGSVHYTVSMAAVGVSLTHHLSADLQRE
jgi:hypothetical protein